MFYEFIFLEYEKSFFIPQVPLFDKKIKKWPLSLKYHNFSQIAFFPNFALLCGLL